MLLIDVPQIAYKTWVIEIHTGDALRDYELEQDLKENCSILKQYPYSADHDHVRK